MIHIHWIAPAVHRFERFLVQVGGTAGGNRREARKIGLKAGYTDPLDAGRKLVVNPGWTGDFG
jgi:hypothetical protein